MKVNSNVSIYTITLFALGLVFLVISANEVSAIGPVIEPGCCKTQEVGGQCIGCPEGDACFASSIYCEGEDGVFSSGGACIDEGEGAFCGKVETTDGCCVIEPGRCVDDTDIESCFLGTPGGPEIFASGASCFDIPRCTPTRNVPTLSNWALIATAAVLVLVGIWGITRKKAQA